jgi:hypothetical protein
MSFYSPVCGSITPNIGGSITAVSDSKLGDRKIDIILKDVLTPPAPVLEIAHQTGIQL